MISTFSQVQVRRTRKQQKPSRAFATTSLRTYGWWYSLILKCGVKSLASIYGHPESTAPEHMPMEQPTQVYVCSDPSTAKCKNISTFFFNGGGGREGWGGVLAPGVHLRVLTVYTCAFVCSVLLNWVEFLRFVL